MNVHLNLNSLDDYRLFLKIKRLPAYRFAGRMAIFPDEYASALGLGGHQNNARPYHSAEYLFDYQRDIAALAIRKKKFACFIECGLGKTAIMLEFAYHSFRSFRRGNVLIVSPLMVITQTLAEVARFYGEGYPIRQVRAADLQDWLDRGVGIGITNYEALTEGLRPGKLRALILDESSCMKGHYGKWATTLIQLGRGLEWKLCLTGTPAPNDRIEFANHAVFLDAFPNVNSFLAKFFVNRGQTNERWELKPHALVPFYRALSHWSIFLTSPATYGWKDNTESIPPIKVHIHDVDMTSEQSQAVMEKTKMLFAAGVGGIGSRQMLGQIAKGNHNGKSITTNKPAFIRRLVDSWPDESTIIWTLYNAEQELMEQTFPEAVSLKGSTPYDQRQTMIDDFKSGRVRVCISKPKVMGWGLNLQIATRQVFSGLQDSWESFHQAVKRSNRIGSKQPLQVHIPVTDVEHPMIETILRKAHRIDLDTQEQERIFKEYAYDFGQ